MYDRITRGRHAGDVNIGKGKPSESTRTRKKPGQRNGTYEDPEMVIRIGKVGPQKYE